MKATAYIFNGNARVISRIQQHIELRLSLPIFPQRGNMHVDCGVTRIDSIEIKFFESRKSDRQRRFYSAD